MFTIVHLSYYIKLIVESIQSLLLLLTICALLLLTNSLYYLSLMLR